MKNKVKEFLLFFLTVIISFMLSLNVFSASGTQSGILTGYIYGPERTVPIKGAVVKAKNIRDGTVYTSQPSDRHGAFIIMGMKEGIYSVGVSAARGDFNTSNLIGVYNGQAVKISFAFHSFSGERAAAIQNVFGNKVGSKKEVYVGEVVKYLNNPGEAAVAVENGLLEVGDNIHVKGYLTDFYQEVKALYVDGVPVEEALPRQVSVLEVNYPVDIGDLIYVIPKRRGLASFFLAPSGVATVVAASTAVAYGIVKLTESENEKSAFKNSSSKK